MSSEHRFRSRSPPLRTNREDEEESEQQEVFSDRAKLYLLEGGTWKAQGAGIAKLINHPQLGTVKLLMLNEDDQWNIRNVILDSDIFNIPPFFELQPHCSSKNTWVWSAPQRLYCHGFRNEAPVLKYALKLCTEEAARQFEIAFDAAKSGREYILTLAYTASGDSFTIVASDMAGVSETVTSEDLQRGTVAEFIALLRDRFQVRAPFKFLTNAGDTMGDVFKYLDCLVPQMFLQRELTETATTIAPQQQQRQGALGSSSATDVSSSVEEQMDNKTFWQRLAGKHGLMLDEYLFARTEREWEKLIVATADRISKKSHTGVQQGLKS